MDDDDDLFASLGGALMKNLLADLNDDLGTGGLLSLEELEQELAHLEDRNPRSVRPLAPVSELPNTAASLVVLAQEQNQSSLNSSSSTGLQSQPIDAWSLSLEKFTSASLQEEFLLADSARKATKTSAPPSQFHHQPPLLGTPFQNAEDYDISEPLLVAPPPGLRASSSTATPPVLVQQLATKLEAVSSGEVSSQQQTQPVMPHPRPFYHSKTPQNSMTFNLPKPPPITPQNSVTLIPPGLGMAPVVSQGSVRDTVPVIKETEVLRAFNLPKPTPATPQNSLTVLPAAVPAMLAALDDDDNLAIKEDEVYGSPEVTMPETSRHSLFQKPEVPAPPTPPNSVLSQRKIFVYPTAPPEVISGPQATQPLPPRSVVYANTHPDARPVPATALASKFMSARDVSFVVHAILKPVLMYQQLNQPTPFDYDRAIWMKATGRVVGPSYENNRNPSENQGKLPQPLEAEMESRYKKAQSWSAENHVLGRTAKTNVARPRALIAQLTKNNPDDDDDSNGNNTEQRQRQTLWKSRIYCDQAYQAYNHIILTWHNHMGPNHAMTPEVAAMLQPHVIKLLKCLGMARADQAISPDPSYAIVNVTALPLLLKLPKGRNLLARALEQALLPPSAVCVLLSFLFKTIYELPLPSSMIATPADQQNPDIVAASVAAQHAEDRLFAAIARVIQTLPDLPGTDILQILDVVKEYSAVALLSPARMQAVHVLLQRGTQLAANDPDFAPAWKTMEDEFLKILSG